MIWTKDQKEMIPNGYRHARLYGHNYRVYIKELGSTTIRCWVKERSLEIEDWYGHTGAVVGWYKENRSALRPYECVILNYKTGAVFLDNISWEDKMDVEKRRAFYEDHRNIYLTHDFDAVIKEVEWLTST